MSFDGNGNYVVPAGTAGVPGTVIDATVYNALLFDLQVALTKTLLRDGQSAMSANLPMGGFKVIGLADGTSVTDAVTLGQLSNQTSSSLGATFIGWFRGVTGFGARTVSDKLADRYTANDMLGFIGNKTADDTTPVSNLIAANTSSDEIDLNGKFPRVLTLSNPYGKRFRNGLVVKNDTVRTGRFNLTNTTDNRDTIVFGREYLFRNHFRYFAGGTNTIHIYGNSVLATAGANGGLVPTAFEAQKLIKRALQEKGVRGQINIVNHAISGSGWLGANGFNVASALGAPGGNLGVLADLTAAAGAIDTIIAGFGHNDVYLGATGYIDTVRTQLSAVRAHANGAASSLAIILLVPGAMFDPANFRTIEWQEQLYDGYIQLAREFQCCLINQAAEFNDPWGPNFAWDNSYGNGATVHPLKEIHNMMMMRIADTLITDNEANIYFSSDPINLTLNNSWVVDTVANDARITCAKDGVVHVTLDIKNGTTAAFTTVATIPDTTMLSLKPEYFFAQTNGGVVGIGINSNTIFLTGAANTYVKGSFSYKRVF
jgi:hypothetical protein